MVSGIQLQRFYKGTFLAGFLKKLPSCQLFKECFGQTRDTLMVYNVPNVLEDAKHCNRNWNQSQEVFRNTFLVSEGRRCLSQNSSFKHKKFRQVGYLSSKLIHYTFAHCLSVWQFPLCIISPFPAEFRNITVQEGLRQSGRLCFPCLYPV